MDIKKSITQINELNLKSITANQRNIDDANRALDSLLQIAQEIETVATKLEGSGFKDAASALQALVKQVTALPQQIQANDKTPEVVSAVKELTSAVNNQKLDPVINVQPDNKVLDFSPLLKTLSEIKSAVSQPDTPTDTSKLEKLTGSIIPAVDSVKQAITALRFPASNYVLPFATDTGKATQVKLNSSGAMPVDIGSANVTLSASDIEIGAVELKNGTDDTRATVTAANALKVDASGAAVPITDNSGSLTVDGTVAATQSGTWTVQPGNTANTTAWKVDGSAVTQPISAASLPLPSGAATNAILTGGTQLSQIVDAGGDVVTVTGGKLDVNATVSGSGSGSSAIDDATFAVASDTGTPVMGLADMVSPDSVNEGDVGVMRMSLARVQLGHIWDAAGNERGANVNASNQLSVSVDNAVTVSSHAVTNAGTFATQATLQAGSAQIGHLEANQTVDVAKINGVTPLMGAGNTGTGSPRVTIATDQVAIPVTTTATAPTTIYNGKKTVTTAGTRVTLASSQAVKSVVIKALAANTGIIYVGDGSVASTTGFALAAGEIVSLDIANLATVNLDSSVNGEGVTYISTN